MELDPSIWSVLIAAIGLVGSVVAARYSKKSQDQSNETSKWEAMFKASDTQMQRLANEIAESAEKVDRLEEKVNQLERDLQAKDKLQFWLLSYVRELIRHLEGNYPLDEYPSPPEQIEDLI